MCPQAGALTLQVDSESGEHLIETVSCDGKQQLQELTIGGRVYLAVQRDPQLGEWELTVQRAVEV